MKRIAIIASILLLLLAGGCKSSRSSKTSSSRTTTTTTKHKEESSKVTLYNDMIDAYGSWETIVAKGNISYGSISSSFEMRMIKDESIQISLRPILGIEVGRLVIADNKIYIYNKVNSQYTVNSLDDFSDKLPFTPTIGDIQNILLGRPFILGSSSLTAKDYKKFNISIAGKDWTMRPKTKSDKIEYMFTLNEEQLESLQASQSDKGRKVICNYQDHQNDVKRMYPSTLQIQAQSKSKKYNFEIDYRTVSWDKGTSIQPMSTKGYSRTTISKLFDSLL